MLIGVLLLSVLCIPLPTDATSNYYALQACVQNACGGSTCSNLFDVPGNWNAIGSMPCSSCMRGGSQTQWWTGSACQDVSTVPPGYYLTGSMYGIAYGCPRGSYCPGGASNYIICPQNFYCPDGIYAYECPQEYTSTGGATVCVTCASTWGAIPNGYYVGHCNNRLCNPGYTMSNGACIQQCPSGQYASSTTTCAACQTCPAGTYTSTACTVSTNTACPACATGTYNPTLGAGSCSACLATCPSGQTIVQACTSTTNAVCGGCPAGFYCTTGSTAATPCPAGSYCLSGSTAPFICPPGSYCPAGASAPLTCAIGTYVGGSGDICPNHPSTRKT